MHGGDDQGAEIFVPDLVIAINGCQDALIEG